YRVAMDDGYVPLQPERTPKHYHFANKQRRLMAKVRFDPAEPTAILYKKVGDGYELEGAMYTAPRDMSEDQLNERVPLSVARWHRPNRRKHFGLNSLPATPVARWVRARLSSLFSPKWKTSTLGVNDCKTRPFPRSHYVVSGDLLAFRLHSIPELLPMNLFEQG